ncbi:FadR/GntR family transcriptional regulator [Salinibacterium sp. NK8237]|uniref:FadR/GntR family transcriptional regulator n=1 Tax=Salinibacterium sp. NK8237 TaxID=2792038 RepID=UPI0018CEA909|nr:FCD domain-containing protein [Salinibacterium sp. NK8237]MBH0130239.1 FadR family transcriptional regulator [Salinibacterium sp. NK8237]
MTPAVQQGRLAAQAAGVLLGRIGAGEWPLGHKLPGETTLAAEIGVGRSTLREAIRELAGQGVLESRQGSGVFVISTDIAEDWDVVLRRVSVASVIEARVAIEAEAAALAAHRRTPSDLRAMRRALARRSGSHHSAEEFADVDMALHREVVAASHNEVLLELFDGFVPRVRVAMIEMLKLRPIHDYEVDQAAHSALVEAIAERNPAAAAECSRAHLTGVHRALS